MCLILESTGSTLLLLDDNSAFASMVDAHYNVLYMGAENLSAKAPATSLDMASPHSIYLYIIGFLPLKCSNATTLLSLYLSTTQSDPFKLFTYIKYNVYNLHIDVFPYEKKAMHIICIFYCTHTRCLKL